MGKVFVRYNTNLGKAHTKLGTKIVFTFEIKKYVTHRLKRIKSLIICLKFDALHRWWFRRALMAFFLKLFWM